MRFSIITAVRNNKAGLLRAIECVRNQTYKNVEHIVVDGGSTDGSAEILRDAQNDSLLSTQYSLLTISEADSGIYDAINKGIKLATGEVIGLLHSDDLYADENVIELYAEAFESDFGQARMTNDGQAKMMRRIDAVYSDLVYVKKKQDVRSEKLEDGDKNTTNYQLPTTNYSLLPTNYSIIRYWKTHKLVSSNQNSVNSSLTYHHSPVTDHLLKNGWMPPHPTLFVRKELFDKYGFYRTDLKIAADYEMILRLFYRHKITSNYLPLTTYVMTIGGASNKSLKNILQKSKEDMFALKLHDLPLPLITLLSKNFRKLPQFLARGLS